MGNRYGGASLLMGGNLDESRSLQFQPRKPASKQRAQVGSINEKTSRCPYKVVNNGTIKCTFSTHQLEVQLQEYP